MVKALLSVKPEYAEKILSGEKIYEFRRRIFKRKDVDILVIYATRPQCRVVAEARIGGIMESTPEDIWKRTNRYGGISHDRFMDYFAGRETALCHRTAIRAPFWQAPNLVGVCARGEECSTIIYLR